MFRFVYIVFCLLSIGEIFGQKAPVNAKNHSVNFVNILDHLDVTFTWTIQGRSQAFMNEGLNQYREGNVETAIRNFDEVIKQNETFWPAYYYRAVCFKNTRNLLAAEKDLKKSIELNPAFAEGKLELGEIFHATGNFEKARSSYEAVLKTYPESVMAHYLLANVHAEANEMEDAQREYTRCTELDPKFPDVYYTRGLMALQKEKNLASALTFFNRTLEVDSVYKPALLMRAILYAEAKKTELAITDLNKLIRLQPGSLFFRQLRGLAFIVVGRYDDAFTDITKIVNARRNPDREYTGDTNIFDKNADLENAADYLAKKGYGLNEESFSLVKKGYCFFLIGNLVEGNAVLDSAIKIEPSAPAYVLKAMILNQAGLESEAIDCYSNALKFDNDIFEAHEKRALYNWRKMSWHAVTADLADMRRLKPKSDILVRFSGMLNSHLMDYPGCVRDLSEFLTSNTDKDAFETLTYCYGKLGAEKSSSVLLASSELALAKGNHERAIKLIDEAITLNRQFDPEKVFVRMKINLLLNKQEDAEKDYKLLKKKKYGPAEAYYQEFKIQK